MHKLFLVLTGIFFIAAGANHFREPLFYVRIVPPQLPWPHALVVISGIAEIAGGLGLMVGRLRLWASWGLVVLLIAVFPANLFMALHPEQFADLQFPAWVYWARLPLQAVLIVWVWAIARPRPRTRRA